MWEDVRLWGWGAAVGQGRAATAAPALAVGSSAPDSSTTRHREAERVHSHTSPPFPPSPSFTLFRLCPAPSEQLVKASVPLSEMFNYVSTLRSMSKGRAQYTMQLERYDVVPKHIQEGIVSTAKVSTA